MNIEKLSPMMQQYMEIKNKHKHQLVLYRLGDFYELFFEDAKIASRELDLVLTGRDCGLDERAPMCGVPHHSINGYIEKLVAKGYKVAICEQVEDAKQAKGIVKRDVVRIITKGTILDSKTIDETSNNYVMSIFQNKSGIGIALCDVSTGAFCSIKSENEMSLSKDLLNEIGKYNPSEIIVNSGFSFGKDIESYFGITPYVYLDWAYNYMTAKTILLDHFNLHNLSIFNMEDDLLKICASGGLLEYLKETQKNTLSHIIKIQDGNDKDYMILDVSSRKNLELIENARDRGKKGSLFWVLNATNTPSGSRLLKSFLNAPLISKEKIEERLNAVEELYNNYILRDDIIFHLKNIRDVEKITSKIIYRSINPKDLISLKASIGEFPKIKELLINTNTNEIQNIFSSIDKLEDVFSLIDTSILEEAPVSFKDGNIFKNGINKDLDELREIKTSGTSWLIKIEEKEKEKTGIKNLKIKYNKIFGYYFDVTNSYLNLVPDYFIRKQTLANSERYITEELKEIEEKILGADLKISELEEAMYNSLIDSLTKEVKRIKDTMDVISLLDVYISLALTAISNKYVKPKINTNGVIEIKNGRHPVVEKINNEFIPNDTNLNFTNRLSIITGPNMAGKSTYMRQVALITLLAQIGSFVPCEYANIGIVDRIFTRVGASDDLATGQSTFMVEMNEVANILNNATKNSLLILDEIGRGTSTFDGLSIAWSILEHIADIEELGAKTLFATHYHELTELEGTVDGVKNYCFNAVEKDNKIVFHRKLVEGFVEHSYGIHVASLAGIPDKLTKRAHRILQVLEDTKSDKDVKMDNPLTYYDTSDEMENYKAVFKQITSIDVDNLTPREALRRLYEIKSLANKEH